MKYIIALGFVILGTGVAYADSVIYSSTYLSHQSPVWDFFLLEQDKAKTDEYKLYKTQDKDGTCYVLFQASQPATLSCVR